MASRDEWVGGAAISVGLSRSVPTSATSSVNGRSLAPDGGKSPFQAWFTLGAAPRLHLVDGDFRYELHGQIASRHCARLAFFSVGLKTLPPKR